jgi:hypothetical protein
MSCLSREMRAPLIVTTCSTRHLYRTRSYRYYMLQDARALNFKYP